MELELQDKVVVVTGGARGIGEAIVRAFAEEKAWIAFLDRDQAAGAALEKDLAKVGTRVKFFAADLMDEQATRNALRSVLESFGSIDVLVNNAGTNDAVGLRHSPAEFANSLRLNLVHYFTCAHHALDALRRSQGCIVNISSKTGVTGQGGTSGYAAAKGAINALTREWAIDLAAQGIRVNCVVPAEVITPMYERWLAAAPDPAQALKTLNQSIPLGRRTTTAKEVAETVVFLASARSSHTTGQIVFVDGGYVHLDRAYTSGASHLKKTE